MSRWCGLLARGGLRASSSRIPLCIRSGQPGARNAQDFSDVQTGQCARRRQTIKAKEYIEELKGEEITTDIVTDLFGRFTQECAALKLQRKATSAHAELAIIREVNDKWNAVARKVPGIPKDGFVVGINAVTPDSYKILRKTAERNQDKEFLAIQVGKVPAAVQVSDGIATGS